MAVFNRSCASHESELRSCGETESRGGHPDGLPVPNNPNYDVYVSVCVCVRACVRARARACVCVCE